uniref:Uncharacterized protein n=1 Tax=Nothobranchius furzeri TaxID=105023 RepID=A0A8C6NPZ9_NOTFU
MMAALGAPEVITQLENAAKVLMVRNSFLFYRHRGDTAHILTPFLVEFGGQGFSRVFSYKCFHVSNGCERCVAHPSAGTN